MTGLLPAMDATVEPLHRALLSKKGNISLLSGECKKDMKMKIIHNLFLMD